MLSHLMNQCEKGLPWNCSSKSKPPKDKSLPSCDPITGRILNPKAIGFESLVPSSNFKHSPRNLMITPKLSWVSKDCNLMEVYIVELILQRSPSRGRVRATFSWGDELNRPSLRMVSGLYCKWFISGVA